MNILIDIGHPAHVHLFKNFAWLMQKKGHTILFTCREKEFEIYLLNKYNFNYITFGKKYTSNIGKIFGLIEFGIKEFLTGLKFKPDIFLSHGSIYAAHAAFLLRKPHITFEDTFNFEQIRLYLPFTTVVLTADYIHPLKSSKVIHYAGYHELAYLHPNNFQLNSNIFDELKINKDESFVVLRFVSWSATHDSGHLGISTHNKIKIAKIFEQFTKVFITSESNLPLELKKFQLDIAPEKIHAVLGHASLVFAESATMVSEGAVLGTPGIYIDSAGRLYTNELQNKYSLVFNYTESENDQEKAIKKGVEILKMDNRKYEWQKRRKKMLEDKIDVTAFLVWFVENYPKSATIMKENPIETQKQFM